jgi:TatD DNase family protein
VAVSHGFSADTQEPPALVDTHAHLHWPSLATDIDGVLARARAAGVVRILTLGTEPRSCRAALALAEKHQEVFAAVGLHPGDIPPDPEPAFDEICSLLSHPRVVAIGETGLDYFHPGNPPRQAQIDAFTRHLELAAQTGKPVCVHNRAATDDVLRLVGHYAGRITPVLHCYTGDLATARAAVALGCYISFAGNVTYPKGRDLLAVAADVPDDRLLLETDAPFLAPQPQRGRRNEPAHITATYDVVAAARGTTRAALGRLVAANAQRLFNWPALAMPSGGAAQRGGEMA